MAFVNLSVGRKPFPILIDVVQYATAPDIVFTLEDYTPPAGASAKIYINKPSGLKVFNNAVCVGNVITYTPTTQAFAELGDNVGQLEIISGGSVLYSFPLVFKVAECIVDSAAVESQDDFTALQAALGTVSQYDNRITDLENTTGTMETDINGLGERVGINEGNISEIDQALTDLIDDLYYKPGETVTLSAFVGNGYSTATNGTYYFYLDSPKRIPANKTLTATACITSIRAPGGRVTSNADNLSNIGTFTASRNNQITIAFSGITNNFTANAPANIVLHTLTFSIAS